MQKPPQNPATNNLYSGNRVSVKPDGRRPHVALRVSESISRMISSRLSRRALKPALSSSSSGSAPSPARSHSSIPCNSAARASNLSFTHISPTVADAAILPQDAHRSDTEAQASSASAPEMSARYLLRPKFNLSGVHVCRAYRDLVTAAGISATKASPNPAEVLFRGAP